MRVEVLFVLVGILLSTVVVVAVGEKLGLPWPALLTLFATVTVFIPGVPALELPADLMLPIFLPPLLWALARRTSWGVIRTQWKTIVLLSVGLVVVTTLTVGAAAYALLPGISFAAAILIGAAIAPPDPVAVDAVAEPAGIPRRIISALQTEGLFNDAASIVAFHLALTAVTQGGHLTWRAAITSFCYSAAVAAFIGWLVGFLASKFIIRVHDSIARNALTWVIPFFTFILAEEVHASGVIAVVIAGVELHSRAAIEAEDRLSGQSFWETVELLFTGVAFGLIGLTVNTAIHEVGADLWHSVMVGVLLSVVAFAVRGVWMLMFYGVNLRSHQQRVAPLRLQEVLLMTWSGMRGLVTLALVLSVPAGAFPFHHELAVIALTVLLVTMVIPGMLLPWLMGQLDLDSHAQAAADKMRTQITERARQAALRALARKYKDLEPDAAARVDQWFDDRLGTEMDGDDLEERMEKLREQRTVLNHSRLVAFKAAQTELLLIRQQREVNPQLVDEILAEVDRMVLVAERNARKRSAAREEIK